MTDSAAQGPGAELKATREGMQVSTREVADALNLPVQVIESLETDDHDRLPPTVFTRGYLRSYARLLELDPDRLLASYPEVTGEVDLVTGETTAVTPVVSVSRQTVGIVGAVVVALVVIGLLVWLLSGSDDDGAGTGPVPAAHERMEASPVTGAGPQSDPTSADSVTVRRSLPNAETVAVTETDQIAETDSETEADPEPPAESGTATAAAMESAESAVATESTTEFRSASVQNPASPAAGTPTATSAPRTVSTPTPTAIQSAGLRERRITEFGDDVVTMVFTEDCWVEVKTLEEVNLYSDLNRAGQTLILTGQAPFRLRLGYAPGVTLSFNGEALPLERHSRNNIANLVVGD